MESRLQRMARVIYEREEAFRQRDRLRTRVEETERALDTVGIILYGMRFQNDLESAQKITAMAMRTIESTRQRSPNGPQQR